jgi:hypothetical protein
MRRWIILLLVTALIIVAAIQETQAQELPRLGSLQVDLWPEYDRPDVLVIYRFNLAETVSLPTTLTLRIPSASGSPHAVAVGTRADNVADVSYNQRAVGEWNEVTFVATFPVVQFEYYDPALARTGEARHFEYYWPGDYAVDNLTIVVQQPVQAHSLRLSPPPDIGGAPGDDGLLYYTYNVGALDARQNLVINLDYQRPTNQISAEMLSVRPSQPLGLESRQSFQSGGVVPVALAVLGIVLIVGAGIWYWQSGQRSATPARASRRRRRAAPAPPRKSEPTDTDSSRVTPYCHRCGKRAADADRFCRSCGARLRVE